MKTKSNIARIAGLAAAAAFMLAAAAASAASAEKEAMTAAAHARYAAESGTLEKVRTYLHHAVNCLVGPDGAEFDPDVLNPCRGMGAGAIADANTTERKSKLLSALDLAKAGLDTHALTVAQDDAHKLAHVLDKIE